MTTASLKANQHGQFALATLVTLVLGLGIVGITVVLRRSRSDVERAFAALKGEVDERRVAEEALRASEGRFRSLVQRASDLTIVTDDRGVVTYVSPAVEALVGYRPDDFLELPLLVHVEPAERADVATAITLLAERPGLVRTIELRLRTHDGRARSVEAVCQNLLDDPDVRGLVWNGRDVTERKALENELNHRAHHDPLTGLPNRALLLRAAGDALRSPSARGDGRRVLVIDLDGFKNVNDTLGHAAGDELLRRPRGGCSAACGTATSRRGWAATSSPSCLRRWTRTTRSWSPADRRGAAASRSPSRATRSRVGACIGIAHGGGARVGRRAAARRGHRDVRGEEDGQGPPRGLRAGTCGSRPRTGRACSRSWPARSSAARSTSPTSRSSTCARGGRRCSRRWRAGAVPAGPGACRTCSSRWPRSRARSTRSVSRCCARACRAAERWRHLPGYVDLGIAVNVSVHQILAGSLADQVVEVLRDSGLPPTGLTLEITESAALGDSDRVAAEFARLQAMGVCIAVDDFGAGYSSLGLLMSLDVDALKIDRSLLDFDTTRRGSLVMAIAELGHTLGLKVVAEGVETPEHLRRAREACCDAVQGFYLSRPLEERAVAEFLAAWTAGAAGRPGGAGLRIATRSVARAAPGAIGAASVGCMAQCARP